MAEKKVTLSNKDGSFGGYLASPSSGEGPGILVIQEIFGVNEFVREICDYHASKGRFALAPDLFWRIEPGVDITDKSEEHWQKAFSLMQAFNIDTGMEDVQTGMTYLRGLAGCTGKVGAVGYCLGGQLAYLSATRTDCDASVGYYGVYIQDRLDEAASLFERSLVIRRGVYGDEHPAIVTALANVGKVSARQRDRRAAVMYLRQALELGQRVLPEGHARLEKITSMLRDVEEDHAR